MADGAALALAALAIGPAAAQPAMPLERAVKAAFVYKFISYVEWPAQAFDTPDAPLVVGVVGSDPIAADLQQIVAGRAVGERPVLVKRWREGESSDLHVLFVGRADVARLPAIQRSLAGQPTLIVTESPGALGTGSMINLVVAPDGRVRFEVALDAAERSGLKLSSRMLALAKAVRPGGS
ncbi:MAG: YfiR family protein [Betaproteobacteria bacterium]